MLYATRTRALDRERGEARTVILMSWPSNSRKRISLSSENPERRPRISKDTFGPAFPHTQLSPAILTGLIFAFLLVAFAFANT